MSVFRGCGSAQNGETPAIPRHLPYVLHMECQLTTAPESSRLTRLVHGNLPVDSAFLWLVTLFTLGLLLPASWPLVFGMTFWGLVNAGLLAARPAAQASLCGQQRDEGQENAAGRNALD